MTLELRFRNFDARGQTEVRLLNLYTHVSNRNVEFIVRCSVGAPSYPFEANRLRVLRNVAVQYCIVWSAHLWAHGKTDQSYFHGKMLKILEKPRALLEGNYQSIVTVLAIIIPFQAKISERTSCPLWQIYQGCPTSSQLLKYLRTGFVANLDFQNNTLAGPGL